MSARSSSGVNARATSSRSSSAIRQATKQMEGSTPTLVGPSAPLPPKALSTGATPSRQAPPTAASDEDQDQDAIYRYVMIRGFRKMKKLSSSPAVVAELEPKLKASVAKAVQSDTPLRELLRRRLARAEAKPRHEHAVKRELYATKLEIAMEALNDVESIDDCVAWFDHMYSL